MTGRREATFQKILERPEGTLPFHFGLKAMVRLLLTMHTRWRSYSDTLLTRFPKRTIQTRISRHSIATHATE